MKLGIRRGAAVVLAKLLLSLALRPRHKVHAQNRARASTGGSNSCAELKSGATSPRLASC